MKHQIRIASLHFQAGCHKRQLNLALVYFVFLVFCVLVFLSYCYFMLSISVQLIAWKDCPRNDLLCVVKAIKHLLTHSPAFTSDFAFSIC